MSHTPPASPTHWQHTANPACGCIVYHQPNGIALVCTEGCRFDASLNPAAYRQVVEALQEISRDAWLDDKTRLRVIAHTADAALRRVEGI